MLTKEALIEALQKTKKISDADLKRVLEEHKSKGGKFSEILMDQGHIKEDELAILISENLGIPVLNLSSLKIDPDVVKLIPKKTAEHYELIPISKIGRILTVAMSDPLNIF